MRLLRSGEVQYLPPSPTIRCASLALAACSWAALALGQGTGTVPGGTGAPLGGTGGTTAPAKPPAAPAEDETAAKPLLPGGEKKPEDPSLFAPLPPGGNKPAGEKPSPFAPPLSPLAPQAPGAPESPSPFSPFSGTGGTGASSLFGKPQTPEAANADAPGGRAETTGGNRIIEQPQTFSAPGFYGGGGVRLTPGTGRLLRPRSQYSVTAGIGFDDNTLQAPTDGGGTADLVFRDVIPEQPEISENVTNRQIVGLKPQLNGSFVPVFRTTTRKVVLVPFRPERVIEQVIPGLPDRERQASVVTSLDLRYSAQWAKARRAFTFDISAGVDYYWSREEPLDYNGSLSLLYVHRLTNRAQLSTALSGTHSSQPDFTQLNVVNDLGNNGLSSPYTILNSKTDLTYKWNRRFSTVTSLSFGIRKREGGLGSDSYSTAGGGNEFRYTYSPRMTFVGESRYEMLKYDGAAGYTNLYLLGGMDWIHNVRFRSTFRIGNTLASFDDTGTQRSSPYGELSVTYSPDRRRSIQLNGRYGFEASSANVESLVSRLGLTYNHSFSPKLGGNASLNYLDYENSTAAGTNTQQVIDASLGLQYVLSRKFRLAANYSFTDSRTEVGTSDYYRNRIFFNGSYDF